MGIINLIIHLATAAYKESSINEREYGMYNSPVSIRTKLDILNAQVKDYFEENLPEQKLKTQEYIIQIIQEIRKDVQGEDTLNKKLDDLDYLLRYENDNKREVFKILKSI